MDYFHQLLESYNKLKKRKLKLSIVESVNPEIEFKAKQAIETAKQKGATLYNAYKVEGIPKDLWIFVRKDGQIKFANSATQKNGVWAAAGGAHQKPIDEFWQQFVSYFEGTGDENQGQEQPMESPQPLQAPPPAAMRLEESLGPLLESCYDSLRSGFTKDLPEFADFNTFVNAVLGENGISIESHITNAFKLNKDGMGTVSENTDIINPNLQERISNRVIKFFEIISKSATELLPDDKSFLENYFYLYDDGSVTISMDGSENYGLNFKDSNRYLTNILNVLNKKFSVKYKSKSFKDLGNTDYNNKFSKILFEEILPLLDVVGKGKDSTMLSGKFRENLVSMKKTLAEWNSARELGAMDTSDLKSISFLNTFVGLDPEAKNTFNQLVKISKSKIKSRKPDYIFPVSEGMIESYIDYNNAVKALSRSEFSEERIKSLIKTSHIKDIIQRSKEYSLQENTGKILYHYTSTHKNYLNSKKIFIGESSLQTINLSISDSNILNKVKQDTGISDIGGSVEYSLRVNKAVNTIIGIPNKSLIKSEDKDKLIKSDTFREVVDMVEKSIKSNNTVDDIEKSDLKYILSLIKEYDEVCRRNDNSEFEIKKDIEKDLKGRISILTFRSRLYNDLISTNKNLSSNARKYLSLILYFTGMKNEDILIDVRELLSKDKSLFTSNDSILPVIKDLLYNTQEWNIFSSKSSIIFSNRLEPKCTLTLSFRYNNESSDISTCVYINKEYSRFLDKNKSKDIISNSSTMIEQLLQNQKKIFEILLSQQNQK